MRGTTRRHQPLCVRVNISIHVPLARDDQGQEYDVIFIDISIHVPLARDDLYLLKNFASEASISIHVPLARDDGQRDWLDGAAQDFNPRPSCEGRLIALASACLFCPFQSTSLLRGTTSLLWSVNGKRTDFNPRPSCEGRLYALPLLYTSIYFNPRPSCEGRLVAASQSGRTKNFNPRPSCEGRHKINCVIYIR